MITQKFQLKKPRIAIAAKLLKKLIWTFTFIYYSNRLKKIDKKTYIAFPCYFHGHDGIEIGQSVTIWPRNRIEVRHTKKQKGRIKIGDGTILQPGGHIGAALEIVIGKRVLIASNVYITDHDHALDFDENGVPLGHFKEVFAEKVSIEGFVWIGEKVCVLKGVTIGYASIIGAGSVVTKDIPPYSVAVGNPARVIKRYNKISKSWESVK